MAYRYLVYGLNVRSHLPLPGWPEAGDGRDVEIRLGSVDLPVPMSGRPTGSVLVRGEFAYFHCHVGSFRIRAQHEVTAMPAPGTDPRLLARLLSGPVLGLLLYRRRVPILHASAVAVPAGAVAFAGDPGGGKSTVASALLSRGRAFVSDDLLPVRFRGRGPVVHSGPPALALSPDAARATGCDPEALATGWPGEGKRIRVPEHSLPSQPLSLARLYLLAWGDRCTLAPVTPAEAVFAFARYSYDAGLHAFDEARLFTQSVCLARAVPVYRLIRPPGLDRVPQLVDLLEEHLAGLGEGE